MLVGLLALFAFVVLSTLKINRNRKLRTRSRRITARLSELEVDGSPVYCIGNVPGTKKLVHCGV